MNILKKLFDHEYRELDKFKKQADQVFALDEKTVEIKLYNNLNLNDIIFYLLIFILISFLLV